MLLKLAKKIEKKNIPHDSYVVMKYRAGLETTIKSYGDTTILITPSKEIAERTKRALDEQL